MHDLTEQDERREERRETYRWLRSSPLVFVVVALVLLLLVPLATQLYIGHKRAVERDIARPALRLVDDIQVELAHEISWMLEFHVSENERYRQAYWSSRRREDLALEALEPRARELGPQTYEQFERLRRRVDDWHATTLEFNLLGREVEPTVFLQRLSDAHIPFQDASVAGRDLNSLVQQRLDEITDEIARAERIRNATTALLVLIALAAAVVVARLTRRLAHVSEESERRRHQAERSQERYQSLAQYNLDGVLEFDPDGHLVRANPAAEALSGYSEEELREMNGQRLAVPEEREKVARNFRRALAGEQQHYDTVIARRDGRLVDLSVTAGPIVVAGEVRGVFTIAEDITARKAAEEERERLLAAEREARTESEHRERELERLTETRERLMRGFSHDVKNPLGAADGQLELLEQGVLDGLSARQRESIERARGSIGSALALIDDLLELVRLEVGRIEFEHLRMDLRDPATEATRAYQAQAQGKGVDLALDLPDAPVEVDSDAARVRQILDNLLSNAIKYTPEGGHILVHVASRHAGEETDEAAARKSLPGPPAAPPPRSGRWVAVDVSDDGRGIPEEIQQALFEEFRRQNDRTDAGAGLGLAISRRLARGLDGDVTVASQLDAGATFTLWLPAPAS